MTIHSLSNKKDYQCDHIMEEHIKGSHYRYLIDKIDSVEGLKINDEVINESHIAFKVIELQPLIILEPSILGQRWFTKEEMLDSLRKLKEQVKWQNYQ